LYFLLENVLEDNFSGDKLQVSTGRQSVRTADDVDVPRGDALTVT